ncbi:Ser-Thr-rich glycosyl-phosphatidyl-inositol-anchored membrane family-domain-containing protein [Aspergillus bertholletiae]|uniref:Ser-Thr-rich glycosyl-phosphatidyl-inositol-anchored membrane family-domain-containing protein n=1 Tax=Aspergillus bertholletiae TaxID=1226010 RepID=A0A5N7APW3_9EURO|nr:Ser-Thr-rich glycosyl-phosphatidyl-inositol-anchored membrane family-domain-containing protein [Aspergillus bertholletiae]
MRFLLPMAIGLAPLISALSITQPSANSTYAAGSTVTVNWTTVDTDPTEISLYLWNFVSWPPSYVPLAQHVPTADQSYSVQIPCDTNPEWGYQISAINGTNVYIIYAQGDRFTVSDAVDGCTDLVPPPASTCGPSAPVSTVYVTVSPTGSSSRLIHHPSSHGLHSSHHHLHSTHALPAPSSTVTASSKSVKPGIVPKTIGWCSDYSHPVTLDKVPTPTPSSSDAGRATPSAVVTAAPGEVTGEPKIVTITTTVSVPAAPGDDRCLVV